MKIRTVLTSAYRLTGLDLDDPRIAEGLRITKLALLRIRQKTEGRANLMVLLIPTKELVYADVMRDKRRNQTYDRLTEMEIKARRDVIAWCADNGIKCIDALPALQSAISQRVQIYPTSAESHPNVGGYAAIASVVNEAVKGMPR
jgi:hypothetical protein